MKVIDDHGRQVDYPGPGPGDISELEHLVTQCLARAPMVLICITGNKGVGKTTLGKFFRKSGFGRYRPRDIAVIDDDCMSVDVLRIFRRKYTHACHGVDELRPFFRLCPKKPVRFYIHSDPQQRISRADILIRTYTDADVRKRRLIRRKGPEKGIRLFEETRDYINRPPIAFDHEITLKV